MRFEWSATKARQNFVKHGVPFELARRVWNDPLHVIVLDRIENGEQRWHAIGSVSEVVLLVVVHTYPAEDDSGWIRIIGARRATPAERRRYEEDAI